MRCEYYSETLLGEMRRCSQMKHSHEDSGCYYHKKMVEEGEGCPAPRGYDDPERVVAIYRKEQGQFVKVWEDNFTEKEIEYV